MLRALGNNRDALALPSSCELAVGLGLESVLRVDAACAGPSTMRPCSLFTELFPALPFLVLFKTPRALRQSDCHMETYDPTHKVA